MTPMTPMCESTPPSAGRVVGSAAEISPVVVIDTREQKPYRFAASVVKTLSTGDYSLLGCEDRVAIERKSKADAYSSLGMERPRFQRELVRLSDYDYGAIVIEASMPDFLVAPAFSRLQPRGALCSLLAWSVRYGVHVFFAGDRAHGNALTAQLLEKFHRYCAKAVAG